MNLIDSKTIIDWIDDIAQQLQALIPDDYTDALMVGIHSGGVDVAKKLHQQLHLNSPLSELNINFYRDDFSRIGLHPSVGPSSLPANIDNRTIILVDDVLYSGRTIRAAMNELFDYGRPARIIFVTLIERPGRELPIQADIIGQSLILESDFEIKLQSNDMSLQIVRKNSSGEGQK